MLDPYASCPCGSGKKFKWCCQAIYAGINKAYEQEEQGQHETALKMMQDVVAEHGGNPEAWGQLARLQHIRGMTEEAERTLEKAFAINPTYPFGFLLRAMFRLQEGETEGALLLARKAADAYSPDAHNYLAEVYSIILNAEIERNRPVAARAAAKILLHCRPEDTELRDQLDALFGEKSRFPFCARRDYTFLPPADPSGPRRAAWNRALGGAVLPRLGDLARAFDRLTQEDATDAPAWFNLALARAWLGENDRALEAIEAYLPLESDDARAETAAVLAEVLRSGAGFEDQGDYCEFAFLYDCRDLQPIVPLLQEWATTGRLVTLPVDDQNRVLYAMVLDFGASLVTAGENTPRVGRLLGYLMIVGPRIRVWGPIQEGVERLREELRARLNFALNEAAISRTPIAYTDVLFEALVFPVGESAEEAAKRVQDHMRRHFEDKWLHMPRRALGGNAPIDAVGHPVLRKKLLGVLRFIQDCAAGGLGADYDFNRLRRKLGLKAAEASTESSSMAPEAAAGDAAAPTLDIAAMGAAELAALAVDSLEDSQLELAYQTAQRLDAGDLASKFARALVARTPSPDRTDRFTLFSYLIQQALADGRQDEALDLVNEGMRVDCEHNGGKRRNDYELRRGQIHVKRGEADAAAEVFRNLIERDPATLRYRTSAVEGLLAIKQPARALEFAEAGLAAARQQQNRDAEEHLLELIAVAKRTQG